MFTGIVESLAKVKKLEKEGTNLRLTVESELLSEFKVDQSVAHNGVCLTVEKINEEDYEVVAVKETIEKTNLSELVEGNLINIERCMQINARLDGHIVQGHVDGTAVVDHIEEKGGSWIFKFKLAEPSKLIVEKGSICINGVSLTAFEVSDYGFQVTIIPYTFENTIFKELSKGDKVNIEFDIVGKYIQRMMHS